MASLVRLLLFVFLLLGLVSHSGAYHPNDIRSGHRRSKRVSRRSCQAPANTNTSACFPALGFTTPSDVPASTDGWWCDPVNEYAFLGFSYEVSACQSLSQLQREFADIRNNFNGRYVRLYGACDREGFYDDVVTAAWDNTLGVHALIWFGYSSSSQWKSRRDTLFSTLHSNPKAKFVTRVVQFGSEPLFDQVLSPAQLTAEVNAAKQNLSDIGIPVTVSDSAYGYQRNGGAQDVLDAIDSIGIIMLPFFAASATTGMLLSPCHSFTFKNLPLGDQAWGNVQNDLNFFIQNGNGKKMYFEEVRHLSTPFSKLTFHLLHTQTGWPSATSTGVKPQSKTAVASVSNEQGYFGLLDDHCTDLKTVVAGGIGWFAHIYSDVQEPGYGIYDSSGKLKFPFAPRTSC
ncbi:glycoside hydrolase family 17 protein [Lactarius hatsudake]|nr:glycoside hydrolase family 17 protein [Lactarius hatsudake]